MEKNQLTAVFYSLLAVLKINETVLFWLFVIMAFDMIFGALKSIVVPELKFSIKAFYFGALRKMVLIFMVLFVATLGKGLGYENLEIITTKAMQTLMITEAISVFYCFKSIWQKKESKPADFISMFIEKIIHWLGAKFEKIMKSLDNNASCL